MAWMVAVQGVLSWLARGLYADGARRVWAAVPTYPVTTICLRPPSLIAMEMA